MRTSHLGTLLLPLMLTAATSFAQKNNAQVYKKSVGRELDVTIKEDDKKHHLRDLSSDTTMLEMIMNAIKDGKVTAYSNYDNTLTQKLPYPELMERLIPKPDTVIVIDPVTKEERRKIISHDFDYSVVHKYRTLEDWTFNPATGNTDIHINGIAPVRDIYVDGDFRGSQAIFWVKYSEVRPILDHYEQLHPEQALALRIWNDYFFTDVKPK